MIKFAMICQNFKIFWKKSNIFPKTQEKFSKLKEKTQNSRKKLNIREDLSSPTLPSGVKKKACINQFPVILLQATSKADQ